MPPKSAPAKTSKSVSNAVVVKPKPKSLKRVLCEEDTKDWDISAAFQFAARKARLIDHHASKIREHTQELSCAFGTEFGARLTGHVMGKQTKKLMTNVASLPAQTALGFSLTNCLMMGAAASSTPAALPAPKRFLLEDA